MRVSLSAYELFDQSSLNWIEYSEIYARNPLKEDPTNSWLVPTLEKIIIIIIIIIVIIIIILFLNNARCI